VVATKPLAPPADVGSRQSSTQPTSSWQPYTWKGREYIGGGVNVYHNRARIYDPAMGRFTSEDPMEYDLGYRNLYAFGWNNPRRWNDPSGLASAAENAAIAGGIVLIAAVEMERTGIGISYTFDIVGSWLASALGVDYEVTACSATAKPKPKKKPRRYGVPTYGVPTPLLVDTTPSPYPEQTPYCQKERQKCDEICIKRRPKTSSDSPGVYRKCVRKCLIPSGCHANF
jgi:RHS repeat-associated protein